jgi:hypothetical protein
MFAAHALKRSPDRIIPNEYRYFYTLNAEETTRWHLAECR